MEILEKIIRDTRGTGNTTWILQAAIENPNCFIVARNAIEASTIKDMYKKLLLKSAWYRKLWWKLRGRKHPKFVSLHYDFRGNSLPVIFDNGALFK